MASTDVDYQPAPQKKSGVVGQLEDCGKFIYDSDSGLFMGRTGASWGKIGIFYLIFYSCLAAFFAAFLAGLLSLMDDKFPNQTGMNSLIKGNPGMGYRPQIDVERTLIHFSQGLEEKNNKSIKAQTDLITKFLDSYAKEEVDKDAEKRGGPTPVDCATTDRGDPDNEACYFETDFGPECSPNNNYGYNEGRPCVLLKMNKVYDWEPEVYESADDISNDAAKANWKEGYLTVTCEGEDAAGKDSIGKVTIYPEGGFKADWYYPYKNQAGYRTPLVFAKFENPNPGTVIQVWCKVWAKNIYHDRNDKAGSVHFEILVD